ncbi:MAG: thiamine pyrophosphate-binding protein [Holophaga sp.]|nr:thiamine pyrophosphate-binding protein [Holophaga sp.]
MKLSDYVIRYLAELGVKHIFMVPGGGAMHLNDSLGNCPGIEFVCNLHEQASAIAAEAYARVTNNLGVALFTTGPGGTNAVTGVAASWLDSTPCLFLSGQVKRADLMTGRGVRQMGVQEINIIPIVKPITKYAITVIDPTSIRYHLEKAIHLSKTGRPGPTWLDIPLDVQAATIEPDELIGFDATKEDESSAPDMLRSQVAETLAHLTRAQRPVILAGNGIRLAGAVADFRVMAEQLGVPILTTWLGIDLIPDNHPLFVGRPGSIAPRGANFALQNSDLLITIGARLDMAMVGYAYDRLARAAKKVIVDIDANEIRKLNIHIDVPVCADARDFIQEMLRQHKGCAPSGIDTWRTRCLQWKANYPVVLPEHRNEMNHVSTFLFSETLSETLPEGAIIASMAAGACVEAFLLAFKVKEGQRIFHNRGTGSMGLALPASLAACLASGGKQTICLEADGGIQMNIQELETIVRMKLPIKIFVLNNGGYSSIRTSQTRHFGRLTGADASSGLTLPDTVRIAEAYGLLTDRIENPHQLKDKLRKVLDSQGPVLCEVMVPPDEIRSPCLSSRQLPDGSMISPPLEDLWPFLPRQEFLENMIIPPLENC